MSPSTERNIYLLFGAVILAIVISYFKLIEPAVGTLVIDLTALVSVLLTIIAFFRRRT